MKRLELRLSNIGDDRIRVFVHSHSSSDSVIPFDRGTRQITILKALNALEFNPKDFLPDEQTWMVDNQLLTADKRTFRSDMRANIGKALYKTLFPEGSNTERALDSLTYDGPEVHVQIEVEGDIGQHRLFDYPWELLCDERGFLIERGINISRYIAFENSPPDLPPLKRINVLIISSHASDRENDLLPLTDEEHQAVHRGLEKAKTEKNKDAPNETYIHIDELPQPITFEKLSQYLLEHTGEDTPHFIHFNGHGHFGVLCRNSLPGIGECKTFNPGIREECKNKHCTASLIDHQGYLLFEDSLGKPDYISAQHIAALLGEANRINKTNCGITLVVLSACKSSFALAENSVFNGVAQRLIGQRIPAVVGMAFSVRVDSAIAFTEHFYRAVQQKRPLVEAMNWGRRMMRLDSNQWYRPVLYMRWQDNEGGQIFATQLEAAPTTEHMERQQTTNQNEFARQNLSPPLVGHQSPARVDKDLKQLDVLSSAISYYNDIKAKEKQLLPVFLLFGAIHVEDIRLEDNKLVAQSPLFGIEYIWPEHCEFAIKPLQAMVQPMKDFYDLLDKALAREFTLEVVRLRSALMTPLRIINDLLKNLIPLIRKFRVVCRTLSSDMTEQRQEIKDNLRALQENLNKIKNPMDI